MKKSKLENGVIILVGALLMGFLWRVRGSGGWGSSWGLLNAGFIYSLFVVSALGERKKMNFSFLTLTSFSFMLTVPAWGTFLTQIRGVLDGGQDFGVTPQEIAINPISGIFMMLCLGFGTASIFGVMLGRGLSDKPWKIKDFVILLVIFIAVEKLASATISHYILNTVQPQAGELFATGLAKEGITDSVYSFYMKNFDGLSVSKKFFGGRNYFSSIKTISRAIAAVGVLLTARFIIKDKLSAKIGTVVCSAFAVAITVADLFFYFADRVGENIDVWPMWEYSTGFIAGLFITATLVLVKPREDVAEIAFSNMNEKVKTPLEFILTYIAGMGINIVRPILERFDYSEYQILATVLAVLGAVIVAIISVKKCGLFFDKISFEKYATVILACFTLYIILVYLFTGENPNVIAISSAHNILSVISAVFVILFSILGLERKKQSN